MDFPLFYHQNHLIVCFTENLVYHSPDKVLNRPKFLVVV
uniref:Uncharacterized protein n=1 Tax=Rhizophora mucronata TaxID=61149 RepID=A0A2P2QPN8_RHIMU